MSGIIDNTRLDEFAEKIFASVNRMRYIREMTNNELAEALSYYVWDDLEVFSLQSDLVESAIERLKNDNY